MERNATLLFANGLEKLGYGYGMPGIKIGELCFNTGMTGYQETLTDPSYGGQIITFTFPHIGNCGTNGDDMESKQIYARAMVTREVPTKPSNWRSDHALQKWMEANDLTGIAGLDTRSLTHDIRDNGAPTVAVVYPNTPENLAQARKEIESFGSLHGKDIAKSVTTSEIYEWNKPLYGAEKPTSHFHVVAVDYGIKHNILRYLISHGCKVTVVPAMATADEITALNPNGVFLSNGPGDPAATGKYANDVLKKLLEKRIPIFGICLGHQLLAQALGGKTEKLSLGHRGSNHPVQNLDSELVEITSQNHGFTVLGDSLPDDVMVTHQSLFDHTNEGLESKVFPAFSVQYHPESSPGPHDSAYLFEKFIKMMEKCKNP